MRPVNATEPEIPRRAFDSSPPRGDVLGVCTLGPAKPAPLGPVAALRERARKRASMSRFDDHPPEEPMAETETITLAEVAALLGVKTLDYVRAELRKAKIVPLPGTAPGLANRFPRAAALAWVEKRKAARKAPSSPLSPRKQERIDRIQERAEAPTNPHRHRPFEGEPNVQKVGTIADLLTGMRLRLDLAEAAVRDAEAEAAKWRTAIEAVEAVA